MKKQNAFQGVAHDDKLALVNREKIETLHAYNNLCIEHMNRLIMTEDTYEKNQILAQIHTVFEKTKKISGGLYEN